MVYIVFGVQVLLHLLERGQVGHDLHLVHVHVHAVLHAGHHAQVLVPHRTHVFQVLKIADALTYDDIWRVYFRNYEGGAVSADNVQRLVDSGPASNA